uniref:purine nucleoside phosphorylase LACC1-like n=1 Tax=Styela clava TaxID=7725 RepID=UPI001939FC52|nr:purine nucleoside phosphorylase LACC1-like [Styela clava]
MVVSIFSSSNVVLTNEHLNNATVKEAIQNCSKLIFVGVRENGTPLPHLKCENDSINGKLIKIEAISLVDAVFKLKKALDEAQILDAVAYIPEENVKECTAVKKLLFPEKCNVRFEVFPINGVVGASIGNETLDFESEVKTYLESVPRNEDLKTVKSNMIPDEIFVHGYSTRYGGCSTWPTMASLNLSYSLRKPDSLLVVKENARRLSQHLGFAHENYHLAKANHGKDIWVYEKRAPNSYDGIATQTPGVLVASPAADCNMLLLADPVKKACGAIHAGWKGILVGVVESAVNAMTSNYNSEPKNIIASLGPSLSVCCCEFGVEESKKFLAIGENVVVWKKGKDKPHLDLRLAVRILLEKSGLKPENIDDGIRGSNPTQALATCTKCDPTKTFFSYRRDGPMFGNCVAFISLK